ncbi:MAG: helix-turn-helix transcriptional regulator [Fimbriimonadia bacterium]|jgi:DNA-binding transcriptional ArsR family regulator
MTPDQIKLARYFKALGEPTRLRIFCFLRDVCRPVAMDDSGDVRRVHGQTVGEVCCHVTGEERVSSAVSFHLKELRTSGLIDVTRQGRHLICSVNPEAVRALANFVEAAEECCVEEGATSDGR